VFFSLVIGKATELELRVRARGFLKDKLVIVLVITKPTEY